MQVLVAYSAFAILKFTWTSQLDLVETLKRWAQKPASSVTETLAVRDQNAIYQDGQKVGTVTGSVSIAADVFTFEEVADTQALRRDFPFEYQRVLLKIRSYGSFAGLKSVVTASGSSVHQAVFNQLVCDRVR